jgi:hypothetical protein
MTLGTRPQVCHACGMLCPPHADVCPQCGAELLVDNLLGVLTHRRSALSALGEVLLPLVALGILGLVLHLGRDLPPGTWAALLVLAVVLGAIRFLQMVGPD